MKELSRKITSLLLALCLTAGFALGVPAYAAEAPAATQEEGALSSQPGEEGPSAEEPQSEMPAEDPAEDLDGDPNEEAIEAPTPEAPPIDETPAEAGSATPENELPAEAQPEGPEEPSAPQGEDEEETAPQATQEEVLAAARQDGAEAARLLATIQAEEDYLAALRAVLNLYYGEEPVDLLEAFLAGLEERGQEVAACYAAAAEERATTPEELGFIPGHIVVAFGPTMSQEGAAAAIEEQDGTLDEALDTLQAATVTVVDISLEHTVEQAVQLYLQDPQVQYAHADAVFALLDEGAGEDVDAGAGVGTAASNEGTGPSQWHLDYIKTFEAWDLIDSLPAGEKSDRKIRVAVADRAPQLDHPDLQANFARDAGNGNAIIGADVSVLPIVEGLDGTLRDPAQFTDDHGTHVTGIIGATANNGQGVVGVASGYSTDASNNYVEVVPIDMFSGKNLTSFLALQRAVKWAFDQKADILNMSVGAQVLDPGNLGSSMQGLVDEMRAARMGKNGHRMLIVSAAGNRSSTTTPPSVLPYNSYPADDASNISVININESGMRSPSSNYGGINGIIPKDISAPGNNIMSTSNGGGYVTKPGTSMASPIVAAVAALMLYANPDLSPDDIEDILKTTAMKLPSYAFDGNGYNNEVAYGCVDALAAVKRAVLLKDSDYAPVASLQALAKGYDSVLLQWQAVPGADEFRVYHMASATAAPTYVGSTTGTAYTCTGLATGSPAYFKVAAYKGTEQGRFGAVVSATPVLAGAASPTVARSGADGHQLSWAAVAGATGYTVYRSAGADGNYTPVGTVYGTGIRVGALAVNTSYYYKVEPFRMVEGRAVMGTASAAVAAGLELATPTLKAKRTGLDKVKLTWNRVEYASGYDVYRSNKETGGYKRVKRLSGISKTSWENTKLALNKAYYYYVVPLYTQGSVLAQGTKSRSVAPSVPFTVAGVKAARKNHDTLRVTWKRNSHAAGYLLYRSAKAKSGFKQVAEFTTSRKTSYTDNGLAMGKTYYYKLRPYYMSKGKRVLGPYSDVASAKPNLAKAKSVKAARKSGTRVQLTWKKVSGADGYYVYRSATAAGKGKKVAQLTAKQVKYLDKKAPKDAVCYYRIVPFRKVGKKNVLSEATVTGGVRPKD